LLSTGVQSSVRAEPSVINIAPWENMAAQPDDTTVTTTAPNTSSPPASDVPAAVEQPGSSNPNLPTPAATDGAVEQPADSNVVANVVPTPTADNTAAPATTSNAQPPDNAAAPEQPTDVSSDTPSDNTAAPAAPAANTVAPLPASPAAAEDPATNPVPEQIPAVDDTSAQLPVLAGSYTAQPGAYGGSSAVGDMYEPGMYGPSTSRVGLYGSTGGVYGGSGSVNSLNVEQLFGDAGTNGSADIAAVGPTIRASAPARPPTPTTRNNAADEEDDDDDDDSSSTPPTYTKSLSAGTCYTFRASEGPGAVKVERSTTSGRSSITRHAAPVVKPALRTVCGSGTSKPTHL
jgi:hypothetical protein